jgi:hypothetical protein
MKIQLLKGSFEAKDAVNLLTQMIHVKIKYHEGKINNLSNEEDIKFREGRIKQLQKDLYDAVNYIKNKGSNMDLIAEVEIN